MGIGTEVVIRLIIVVKLENGHSVQLLQTILEKSIFQGSKIGFNWIPIHACLNC